MWVMVMFPSLCAGSTKWSQEYRSPVCSRARAVSPRGPGRLPVRGILAALDDRDVLVEARAALVAKEAVDLHRVVGVGRVQRGQGVVLAPVLLEKAQAAHDLVEGALAALVDAE